MMIAAALLYGFVAGRLFERSVKPDWSGGARYIAALASLLWPLLVLLAPVWWFIPTESDTWSATCRCGRKLKAGAQFGLHTKFLLHTAFRPECRKRSWWALVGRWAWGGLRNAVSLGRTR